MKPEWRHAPSWANYMAMDRNGEWFWFENEPKLDEAENIWRPNQGRNERAYHWKESTDRRVNHLS